jgi:hypothetical protein
MALLEQINGDILQAMKAKDQSALRGLRAIKSAILLAQTEKADVVLDATKELQILQKLAKQRNDSMEIYKEQGREDLYLVEKDELSLIEKYLPKQLSDQELKDKLQEIIRASGLSGKQALGPLMGKAGAVLSGQADNKRIAQVLRELLES